MKFSFFKPPFLGIFSDLFKAALLFGVLLAAACDSNSSGDRSGDDPNSGNDSPENPPSSDTSPGSVDRKGSEDTLRFVAYLLIESFMVTAEELSELAADDFTADLEFWPIGLGEPDANGMYTRHCLSDGTQTYLPTEDPKGVIMESFSCQEQEPVGLRTRDGKLTLYEHDPTSTGFDHMEVYQLEGLREEILLLNDNGSTVHRLSGEEVRFWTHGMGLFEANIESDIEMNCGAARTRFSIATEDLKTEWQVAGSISLTTEGDFELGGEGFANGRFQVATEEPVSATKTYNYGSFAFYQGKVKLENHEGTTLDLEFVQGGVYINEAFYSGEDLRQDELWAFSSDEACLAFAGGPQWEPPIDPDDGTGSPEDPPDGDWAAQISGVITAGSGESDGAAAFVLGPNSESRLSISSTIGRTSQSAGLDLILLTPFSGEGDYDLSSSGEQTELTHLILSGFIDDNDYRQWTSAVEGSTSTLTVTEFLPDRIKGYLNATLYPFDLLLGSPSDPDPVTVTAEFDLPLVFLE